MRHLADRVILSKSGVTRLIDRLVADGLVERDACLVRRAWRGGGPDRRPGSTVCARASRTHLRGIDEHFLAALDADDLPVIERSMRAVADARRAEHDQRSTAIERPTAPRWTLSRRRRPAGCTPGPAGSPIRAGSRASTRRAHGRRAAAPLRRASRRRSS